MDNPLKHFADLRDPRVEQPHKYLLNEHLFIAVAAILSGASRWNEIENDAHCKQA